MTNNQQKQQKQQPREEARDDQDDAKDPAMSRPSMTTPPVTPFTLDESTQDSMKAKHDDIRTLIESFVRDFVFALNNRSFPLSNTSAAVIDPEFCATALPPFKFTFDEYCAHLMEITQTYPEYHLNIRSLDSYIDVPSGHAHVFMDFEMGGVPVGLLRRSVAVVRFRRSAQDGKWRCFEYQSADGLGSS